MKTRGAAMMVGRDVNFKVDKKDQEAGEVVLYGESARKGITVGLKF